MSHELALDMARSQLASQKEDLRAFRNQAGFMSATTGVVAVFFSTVSAGTSFANPDGGSVVLGLGIVPLMVLVCFSLSIMFSIRVVTGWSKVKFDLDIQDVNKRIFGGETHEELVVNLSNELDKCAVGNETTIRNAKDNLFWAGIFSFAQIVAWIVWLSQGA